MKKIISLIIVLCLTLAVFAGCAKNDTSVNENKSENTMENTEPSNTDAFGRNDQNSHAAIPAEEKAEFVSLSSYGDVKAFFDKREEEAQNDMGTGAMKGAVMAGAVTDAAVAEEAETPMEVNEAAAGYSGTNVQIEGIDEGDVVKTDGEYIYVLRNGESLLILKADGENTRKVSETTVSINEYSDSDNGSHSISSYPMEMYISGDKLAIVSSYYEWTETRSDGGYSYENIEKTEVKIYDISDRSSPERIMTLGQDGYNNSTRLNGNTLYLITNYFVYDHTETDADTDYVPKRYSEGTAEVMPINDILIPSYSKSTGWVVVSAIDLDSCTITASKTLLGNSSDIFMNDSSLYILSTQYSTDESEPYMKDQYTVVDYTNYSETGIFKFEIDDGTLDYTESALLRGYVDSQFSADEYEGYFRLVLTENFNDYSVYTDEKYGFTNYEYKDSGMSASLYVLGDDLSVVGSISGLGEDERVYSCRFDGDIAYFVTFRETDPLFAVDLSDPAEPKVLSALKIPGFSEYLHFFSEGELFGLGMNVDESTGWTDKLKLTMFDVTEPSDVREKDTLVLDFGWTEALYDHHAVFVNGEKNIIAFHVDDSFVLYRYTERGFELITQIDFEDYNSIRSMYIGDNFYIVSTSGKLCVLSLDTFENILDTSF